MAVYYDWFTTDAASLSSWTTGGAFWYPSANGSCSVSGQYVGPRTAGVNFVSSANVGRMSDSTAYRDIDISSVADEIDEGDRTATLSGWIASFTPDEGNYALEFYDASNVIIGARISGTPIAPDCTWTEQSVSAAIPVGTRKIRIILVATYKSGSFLNAYFTDFNLDIDFDMTTELVVSAAYVNGLVDIDKTGDLTVTSAWVQGLVELNKVDLQQTPAGVPTSIACFA